MAHRKNKCDIIDSEISLRRSSDTFVITETPDTPVLEKEDSVINNNYILQEIPSFRSSLTQSQDSFSSVDDIEPIIKNSKSLSPPLKRSPYKCQRCGQPKRGHFCTTVQSTVHDGLIQTSVNWNGGKLSSAEMSNFSNSDFVDDQKNKSFYDIPNYNPPISVSANEEMPSTYYVGWFDLAISGIENLVSRIATLNWKKREEIIPKLNEQRRYLEQIREEYQIDTLITPEGEILLGKRSTSIVREFEENLLSVDENDVLEEPAKKINK